MEFLGIGNYFQTKEVLKFVVIKAHLFKKK